MEELKNMIQNVTGPEVQDMIDHVLRTLLEAPDNETSYFKIAFSFSTSREYDPRMQKTSWVSVFMHLVKEGLIQVSSPENREWRSDYEPTIYNYSDDTNYRLNPKRKLHIETNLNYGI